MPSKPRIKSDALAYIRLTFNVPARRGMSVLVQGRSGVITGASGDWVRVRLDGERQTRPFPPHDLKYL